jgi:hypothetical protein
MSEIKKIVRYHIPDWHKSLSPLLGNIEGEEGYVTNVGTIRLIGQIDGAQDIPKSISSTQIEGPTIIFSALNGLGLA